MEKKKLQQYPASIRDAYNRALKSGAQDLNLSISLMKDVVKKAPELVMARERLRDMEKRKMFSVGFLGKTIAQLAALFKTPGINSKIAVDPIAAMGMCEDLLSQCLDNPMVLNTLADAALVAEAPFIAVDALLLNCEFHPKSEKNTIRLARAMQKNNQAREAVKLFQELAARHPNNMDAQSELRAALALASMERGKWEEKGSSQQKAVDAKDAVAQQLIEGTIHDANQAKMLIEKYTKELEAKESSDTRKRLAEAYMVAEDYAKAIEEYQKVATAIGSLDPFIDKAIEKAYCAQIKQAVTELKKNAAAYENPEQQIADLEAQRNQYQLERAQMRSQTYPKDALLHFDLAERYFENGDIDHALPEFQQAVHSPQKRTSCQIYLGRCFAAKNQNDMAMEQYEAALENLSNMDKQRWETLYYLGNACEASGHQEKAMNCYKEIYQNQANFLDVAQRIDRFYQKA